MKTGDIFELGYYPQSLVTDEDQISKLNNCIGSWISYNYCDETGNKSNYMRCKDVVLNGTKYRAVMLDEHRLFSAQDINGFEIGIIYWFEYQPLKWVLLDDQTGLSISKTVIDSTAYNHTSQTIDGYFANNYEKSDVREWLLNTFVETAFSNDDLEIIMSTTLDNYAIDSKFSSVSTADKVFLLSKAETDNMNGELRPSHVTGYAKIQGCYMNADGYARDWALRTAANNSYSFYYVHMRSGGYIAYYNWYDDVIFLNTMGIKPAI